MKLIKVMSQIFSYISHNLNVLWLYCQLAILLDCVENPFNHRRVSYWIGLSKSFAFMEMWGLDI